MIDAWVTVSLAGIDLLTIPARVVIASLETSLKHVSTIADAAPISSSP